MAAVVETRAYHGGSAGSPTAPTGPFPAAGRFHWADTDPTTDGATTYIQVPTSGTVNSWRKSFKIWATTAPAGTISNLRWYDGVAWGTGLTGYAKVTAHASYTPASSADQTMATTGYTTSSTYTSGSPLTVNAGTILTAATGDGGSSQSYVEVFIQVGTTAGPGTTSAHTLNYVFDET